MGYHKCDGYGRHVGGAPAHHCAEGATDHVCAGFSRPPASTRTLQGGAPPPFSTTPACAHSYLCATHTGAPHSFHFHPRFDGATAWLDAYTRDPASSTNDGPPSLWTNINDDLKAAVVACMGQSASGNCACSGTSCSSNPRFTGPIGIWDVSEATWMAYT